MTTPTSRTESRCQPPSDSGSNTRVPLKATLSMVAKQARLQSEGSPSTSRGRPCRSDAACGHRRAVLGVSPREVDEVRDGALVHDRVGLSRNRYSPSASSAARFTPAAKPTFSSSASRLRGTRSEPSRPSRRATRCRHHDLEVDAVRVLVDRGQAVARLGAALVRDDQDRDVACQAVLEFRRDRVVLSPPDDASRIADRDRVRREVAGDHRARADDAAVADRDAGADEHSCAEPDVVSDDDVPLGAFLLGDQLVGPHPVVGRRAASGPKRQWRPIVIEPAVSPAEVGTLADVRAFADRDPLAVAERDVRRERGARRKRHAAAGRTWE